MRRNLLALPFLDKIAEMHQVGRPVVSDNLHGVRFEGLSQRLTYQLVDALRVELGCQRLPEAVDGGQLGRPALGFRQQALGFTQQACVFEGNAQGIRQGLHQPHVRGAEALFLLEVLD